MKQKPIHEIEAEAAQQAIEDLYAIRPDLYTEELRRVIFHVAREAARKQTELLTENGYVATRTTGAPPPEQPSARPDPFGLDQTKLRTEDLASMGIALALDLLPALLSKTARKPNS